MTPQPRPCSRWFLIAGFLLTIWVVPVTQAVIELTRGEAPQILDLFRRAPTEANLRAFERDLESASWFSETWQPTMRRVQFALLGDPGDKALVGRDGWLFYRPGVRYLTERWPREEGARGGDDDPVRAIVAFRDQLAARGVALLVVPVPGKASVYPEKLTARAERSEAASTHTARILDALRAADVAVVDLFAVTAQARSEPDREDAEAWYLARDTHWSPAGIALAVREVTRVILARGWTRRGTHAYATRPVTVTRPGDVLRMMDIPGAERVYPPETIICQQVVSGAGDTVYRDDPDAEILVLGDSFLRIYQRDEPGAAGFIAHLARELGQPLASIVNDGGASTLVRQELARKPHLLVDKTLVIWEFVERDLRFGTEGWQDVKLPR